MNATTRLRCYDAFKCSMLVSSLVLYNSGKIMWLNIISNWPSAETPMDCSCNGQIAECHVRVIDGGQNTIQESMWPIRFAILIKTRTKFISANACPRPSHEADSGSVWAALHYFPYVRDKTGSLSLLSSVLDAIFRSNGSIVLTLRFALPASLPCFPSEAEPY